MILRRLARTSPLLLCPAASLAKDESERLTKLGLGSTGKGMAGAREHPEIDLITGSFEIGSRLPNLVNRPVA